jgi:nucleoside-diphosphate-sugar epimerase
MIERFARMFNKERGTKVNLVRCVNAYGPRQSVAAPYGSSKVRKITPSFICRALNGDPIEVYGSGEQISDMVYVGDVAKTLVAALNGPLSQNVIEVGPSESHTVNYVAELVSDLVFERGYEKVPVNHLPMRPGENPDDKVVAENNTCLEVGVDPAEFKSLLDGFNETIDWFESQKNITWFGA